MSLMNKSILLVTKFGKNFGTVLQAYALSQILKSFGCNVTILNYPADKLREQFKVFRMVRSLRDAAYNFMMLFKCKKTHQGIKRFQQFRAEYFDFSEPFNSEEKIDNPPLADVYLVGSDQVWNPKIMFSPIYFLHFGNRRVKRASYAASIGLSAFPKKYIAEIKEYLNYFQSISVRETSGQEILHHMGINAKTTVDPTLLLSKGEWAKIAVKPVDTEKYILVYSLYNIDLLKATVDCIKKQTGYKVKTIATSIRLDNFGDHIIWDAGPREFIGLIEKASIVITSSYHGMLFSLNFGIPFLVIPPEATRGRFYDLLQSIGLENRIIGSLNEITTELLSIDTNNKLLREQISASKQYLASVVNDN